ncbi:MAG: Homeodomain-like domain-containing protein [Candidatus Nitrotoga sp. MKT]|nr:MAG: Homeodomain-like domain-containing protein [Candidatus Nitrotoga sp. MKT]
MGKLMSQKEVKRARLLDMLEEDKISQQEASKRIGVSTRQVRRLPKRYWAEGLGGLVSKKRGSASNWRLDEAARTTATESIGTHYRDFGPTLANEKLAGLHGIQQSVGSTRQLMIVAGYWRTRRSGTVCTHPMRERRARFGELIPIDGSPPTTGLKSAGNIARCGRSFDDAIGRLTQLRFTPTETTLGYMRVLHDHIWIHGAPAAPYQDRLVKEMAG